MPQGNGIPGPLDAVAYIHINLFGNGEMSISGNVHDTKLALQLLDHARDTIKNRQVGRSKDGLIVPAGDVEVTPTLPLTPHGDVSADLRPVLDFPGEPSAVSGFLGSASGGTAGVGHGQKADDRRLLADEYGFAEWFVLAGPTEPFRYHGYQTPWWPGGGRFDASGGECLASIWWGKPALSTGTISRFVITGVTRDANKSILPSCIVKLFKTADGNYAGTKDTKIDEAVSDPNTGQFYLTTPYYPDAHYVVMQKTGVPDVQGVTVNTLIGS